MPKLTNDQVKIELLRLLGYEFRLSDLPSGLIWRKDGGEWQHGRLPELDHNLIWEAEEKLLFVPNTEGFFYRWGIYLDFLEGNNCLHPDRYIRHPSAIDCARALLKTMGVENA